jgi:hypothetical protein
VSRVQQAPGSSPTGPRRREFLYGLSAGALITGFDPISRRWITGSVAAERAISVPPLKGRLLFGSATLAGDADDFGHLIHSRPWAVLQPGDIDDIVAMLRFCDRRRIAVAPRGQGHATYGQAQVSGGLVIEMSTLGAIEVGASSVAVQAGARWSSVLDATLARGLTPPVFTDYLELSIGGTLSAGGIGGASPHYGAQADNVLELEVVTGAGERVTCSLANEPDLFRAVLSGLGQCAVVVRATLPLLPAPASAGISTSARGGRPLRPRGGATTQPGSSPLARGSSALAARKPGPGFRQRASSRDPLSPGLGQPPSQWWWW